MSHYISWPSANYEANAMDDGTSGAQASAAAVVVVESQNGVKVECGPELTMSSSSPTSRQPSSRVSSSPQTSPHHFVALDAISAQQTQPTTRIARHEVHSFVKNSASSTSAPRSYGQNKPSSSSSLETSVSSSSQQPFSQHGLTNPSTRLRTPVFQSSKDLAAHYGIPQFLPPAPRTTPRITTASPHQRSVAQQPQNQFPDFDQIKNSYLAMLSSKPEEATTTTAASTAADSSTSPGGAGAVASSMAPPPAPAAVNDQELQDLLSIIGENNSILSLPPSLIMTHYLSFSASAESPEFKDSMNQFTPHMDMDAYLTSPLPSLGHDFDESPRETPLNDFLSTPLFDSIDTTQSAYSSPLFTDANDFDMDIFGYSNAQMFVEPTKVHPTSAAATMPSFDIDALIPFTSPEQPMEDSFPAPHHHEQPPAPTTSNVVVDASTTELRRRGGATGTRKGITPDSLIPLDAPTQPRKYTTPSATSRKDLPAVFARKRARSQAFGDDGDQDDDELARHEASPPGPNATEREQIEWKRRQNTLAARKSRKRKLEHQQRLEEDVKALTRERDCWRTRAGVLQQLLVSHGVPFERWEDEE
ncbi:hypothetical protein BKA70DRAFT_1571502 [Coprinopsis sp. MPI-PUGE-AT-0042]|nr:hypothetical protein BKA70DRAFT_1571502 [Coprinopsis sp. MPI-PUGE-AT-0042]